MTTVGYKCRYWGNLYKPKRSSDAGWQNAELLVDGASVDEGRLEVSLPNHLQQVVTTAVCMLQFVVAEAGLPSATLL